MEENQPGLVKVIAWCVLAALTAALCFWADPQFAQFAAFALFFTVGIGLVLAVDHWLMPEYESFIIVRSNPVAVSVVVAGLLLFAGMCAIAAVWAFAPVPAVGAEYVADNPSNAGNNDSVDRTSASTVGHSTAIRGHAREGSQQRMVDGSSEQVRGSSARLELLRQFDQPVQSSRRREVADASDSMGTSVRDTRTLVHDQRHLVGTIHAAVGRHPCLPQAEWRARGVCRAVQGEGDVRVGGVQYIPRSRIAA